MILSFSMFTTKTSKRGCHKDTPCCQSLLIVLNDKSVVVFNDYLYAVLALKEGVGTDGSMAFDDTVLDVCIVTDINVV